MKYAGQKVKDLLSKVRFLLLVKGLTPDEYDHLSRIELEITINLVSPNEEDFEWVHSLYSKHQ